MAGAARPGVGGGRQEGCRQASRPAILRHRLPGAAGGGQRGRGRREARGGQAVTRSVLRAFTIAFAASAGMLAWLGAAAAADIQQVRSPGGIAAWLVQERSLPIVTIRFAFDGGSAQEPMGKEGTAGLLAAMLDQGAG